MENEHDYDSTKDAVLGHIREIFEELEQEAIMSHQEKYALLEDAFENATDVDELRVAFDQWYSDHVDELGLDVDVDELWDQAVSGEGGSFDSFEGEDDFDYKEEEEEEEEDEDEDEEEEEEDL
ncbi:MAG: hypothetical protein COV59_01705 [Candidatus Magasanikbacteria bacterium CG11_big_fil_rev_8_21_14_0_20_39_34]|uniref:Uncharacterized protein n=1 Tax=Candidatus Magasanikbacteria bacterium CG11_big_fil_rev_8_21_14_0_20_39_34 TaxID=1974653 RepID=A0A2H0N608_9BACT|nr:MAG: hypothetical protein COV59_01705 [Candidatus Magasanikbacteria bacterium CG11_big_fil_rev_8_21_14_0_20_39_34]